MQRARKLKFEIAAVALGLFVAFVVAEVLLRLLGFGPWHYVSKDVNEPTMHLYDPELGWVMKEGSYVFEKGGRDIQVTNLSNHTRATAETRPAANKTLVFVGGSVTHGWALADEETFAWQLQSRYPTIRILNYATAGYGTYQSLLMMERIFAEPEPRPDIVIYGFNWRHEHRNVAPSWWLAGLTQYARRNHVFVPYCTLNERGELVRHPPERYPEWPLREYSATVNLFQTLLMNWKTQGRESQKRAVTENLLLAMNRLCLEHEAQFVVVLLSAKGEAKPHYLGFLDTHDIDYIDCAFPIPPEMRVPGDGHPNATVHGRWTECISAGLDEFLADGRPEKLSLHHQSN